MLLGLPGVWKTHLAISLGIATCQNGPSSLLLIATAIDLAHRLSKAVDQNRLHRQIKALMQPKLLIIDEVGYLAFDPCKRACCSR